MSEATEVKASTHRCSRVPTRSRALRPALCGLVFSLIVIPDASVLPDLGGVMPRGLRPAAVSGQAFLAEAGVGGELAGLIAAVPGGWADNRAAEGQGDDQRQPAAEQADRVHNDERETAGAEPVGQPDRVTAGVGGHEARRDLTRCAAGEHLPGLQERSKGGEHTIDGCCGAEDLGEHHPASFASGYSGCSPGTGSDPCRARYLSPLPAARGPARLCW